MTERNSKFLQETAFEDHYNPDIPNDEYWKSDESKKRVADKFSQWLQHKNK